MLIKFTDAGMVWYVLDKSSMEREQWSLFDKQNSLLPKIKIGFKRSNTLLQQPKETVACHLPFNLASYKTTICSQRYRVDRGYSYKHILKNKIKHASLHTGFQYFITKTRHISRDLAILYWLETLFLRKKSNSLE